MRRLAKKTIFKVQPYVPGKPIDEVRRERGLKSVIKLASNENPYGPSPKVLKAILTAAREVNRYPAGDCYYLRRALAARLKVAGDQLVFGNGSDEIIVLAVRAFLKEGEEVILARPSFLIYEIASKIAGAKIKAISLKKNFSYNLDAMKRAVTRKTRIVFLGNPDNPSGKYFTQDQVNRFLKGLRPDILVFIDEAYFEYVRAGDYVDSIGLLKKHKNVIVTRTFSKMYGLAGLRVGYGIAHREVADCLERIREPFNVNAVAQAAALACLKNSAYYRGLARRVENQRNLLYLGLRRLGLDYVQSYTNFVLINTRRPAPSVSEKLLRRGVIVRNMAPWGLKRFIRVTIGTPRENKRFLKALKAVIST